MVISVCSSVKVAVREDTNVRALSESLRGLGVGRVLPMYPISLTYSPPFPRLSIRLLPSIKPVSETLFSGALDQAFRG